MLPADSRANTMASVSFFCKIPFRSQLDITSWR
jgi:hypothetical protein